MRTTRSPRRGFLSAIVVTCLGLTFGAACGGGSSAKPASSTRPTTKATLQIASPGPNAVTGRRVQMVMALTGAQLVAPTKAGDLRPDRGHIHIMIDGRLVSMPARLRVELPALKPGPHTVHAEFVALDHLPFANRVVAVVTFDAK